MYVELPPPNTRRWVIRRKAALVAAVRAGDITLEEVCRRYHLSRRSSSPGSVRSKLTALPACARLRFKVTATLHRPNPPSRVADQRGARGQPRILWLASALLRWASLRVAPRSLGAGDLPPLRAPLEMVCTGHGFDAFWTESVRARMTNLSLGARAGVGDGLEASNGR
jgi:hypothetical protein